ncbi:MAG: hypothetical protein J1F43_00435 [Muribaculaceae bacterium]|nr:hypothetical protein [Muribaculaceae bacterium]
MRKLISFIAIGALLASCGGNTSSKEENNEDSIVVEESIAEISEPTVESSPVFEEEGSDEVILTPPFSIKGVWEEINDKKYGYGRREYYNVTVNKNGTYKIEQIVSTSDSRSNGKWYSTPSDSSTYEGRWTVAYRAMGETSQKVYDLRRQNGDTRLYIPEDGEYFWDASSSFYHPASWESVANLNFNNAIKVAEYTKNNKTTVLIPEAERITATKQPITYDLVGKKYVDKSSDCYLDFNNKRYVTITFGNKETKTTDYYIQANEISIIGLANDGELIDGDKTIRFRRNQYGYPMQFTLVE